MITFHEKTVDVLYDEKTLQARIAELGAQITRDYQGKELTLLCVLKGSIFFVTDLARAIDLPLTIEFLGASSYHGGTESTGEVRITTDVSTPLKDRHVLVCEDIIDTGLTMSFLLQNLSARHPASVKLCTLLAKPSRAKVKIDIDYTGFVIEDHFVVGYGLDYEERLRNVPFIGVMKPGAI